MSFFRFSLFAVFLVCVGCSSNPTAQDVVNESVPPICDKVKECAGDAKFTAAYPGGTSECVTKTTDSLKQKYGSDLSKDSVCSDDDLTKCLNTFKAEACKADGTLPDIPCNC